MDCPWGCGNKLNIWGHGLGKGWAYYYLCDPCGKEGPWIEFAKRMMYGRR